MRQAVEVGGWAPRNLEVLLRDVRELLRFLERANVGRAEQRGQDVDRRGQAVFSIYGRGFTLDDLERRFYGNQPLVANDLLRRAAVLHADIGMFVPGTFSRYPLVEDGGRRGWREGSWHWEVGRLLLDGISPSDSRQTPTRCCGIARSPAHLFRAGNLAQVANHLNRARDVFPQSPHILIDSAYLHQELSSPPVQGSLQTAARRRRQRHRQLPEGRAAARRAISSRCADDGARRCRCAPPARPHAYRAWAP